MIRDCVKNDFDKIYELVSSFVEKKLIHKTGMPTVKRGKEVYSEFMGRNDIYKKVVINNDEILAVLIMIPYYSFFNHDPRVVDAFWITDINEGKLKRFKACMAILKDMFDWAEDSNIKNIDLNLTYEDPAIVRLLTKLGFKPLEKIYTKEI